MAEDIVLETEHLTKSFRGFTALRAVDLRLRRGTIHALIGPNGAGKTTCFNLISKFLDPSAGRIRFAGRDITRLGPAEVARLGLVRSFQISAVFPQLSALANVRLALQRAAVNSFAFWRSERVLDHLNGRAHALLAEVGLTDTAEQTAGTLPYGQKRVLELATTLALDPIVMLLDEPMAGMGQEDVARTKELIRQAARGRTVLMVEHNLGVVAELSDVITVLARGEVLAEGDYETVARDPRVIEAYLGGGHA